MPNSPYTAPTEIPVMMTCMRIPIGLPRLGRKFRSVPIIARVSLVAMVLLLGACSSGGAVAPPTPQASPTPTSKAILAGPNCHLPKRRPTPVWMPDEVPFPAGTYFYKPLSPKKNLHRGLFVMRVTSLEFKDFVDSKWTPRSIQLLRPDQEPGELEDIFRTPRGTGLFKANDVICETPYTRLLLVYGK
jgi:hypothetical protein